MDLKEDTWKDRNGLVGYAYGLNIIMLLIMQIIANYAFQQLSETKKEEVIKLIKSYAWKTSKKAAALVIEQICQLLNPKQEIVWLNAVLDNYCFRNSFFGHFGLNHIFAVIFLPLLVKDDKWQKNFWIAIKKAFRKITLFGILEIHKEILSWHQTKGATKVCPIFGLHEDFVHKATYESSKFVMESGKIINSKTDIAEAIKTYEEVKLKFGRVQS